MPAVVFALATIGVPLVAGHGQMTYPPTRQYGSTERAGKCQFSYRGSDESYADGLCRWFNQGCQPGCSECTDTFGKNPCGTPSGPTLGQRSKLRTWQDFGGLFAADLTKHNPWRSPGAAPVFSPCGLAGGGKTFHPANGAAAPHGVPQGYDGRQAPELEGVKTVWPRGSKQPVAWAIHANHGGGYAYRLCPKTGDITEECFQSGHLRFAGENSWIGYDCHGPSDCSNRTSFTAARVSTGTQPKGSQWTKNPIPACAEKSGGVGRGAQCTAGPMFSPPVPGLYGYGPSGCANERNDPTAKPICSDEEERRLREQFSFNIIDRVEVPTDLPTGEYLLSFRWDCEQTPQVWAQCADVTITEEEDLTV